MKKYIIIFAISYSLAMLLIALIETLFNLPGGTAIACLFIGGITTSAIFVKDFQRLPNPTEKRQLIWGCFITSVVISIITTYILMLIYSELALLFTEILNEIPFWIIFLAFLFTLVIHYLVLRLCFGWLAQRLIKK